MRHQLYDEAAVKLTIDVGYGVTLLITEPDDRNPHGVRVEHTCQRWPDDQEPDGEFVKRRVAVSVTDKPRERSASYLSPPDFHRLNWACLPITEAFGTPPYLVGSSLTRPDFRDIDLRLILDDEAFDRMFSVSDIKTVSHRWACAVE